MNKLNPKYELFILALGILSLFNVLLWAFFRQLPEYLVLVITNYLISIIYFLDFIFRLLRSEQKSTYFLKEGGWADLVSSFPFPLAYLFRLVRIIRGTILLRSMGYRGVIKTFFQNRADSALLIIAFLIILILQFGSFAVFKFELPAADSNIASAGDALWWTFVTITTIGYGDRFPVTTEGRLVGILVMIVGVGLFGVLTGYLANSFLKPNEGKEDSSDQKLLTELLHEVRALREELKNKS